MKIIPFPIKNPAPERLELKPDSDADIEEVLAFIDSQLMAVVLFVDRAELCQKYVQENPWIMVIAATFEVDQEIVDHFAIKKVPQWRWYVRGTEVHHLIGAANANEVANNNDAIGAIYSVPEHV